MFLKKTNPHYFSPSNILHVNLLKTKILRQKLSNIFFLRLIKIGKNKSSIFKVVVTNWNHRRVDIIGTILLNDNQKIRIYNTVDQGKYLSLDFEKLLFWVKRKAIPTPFLHHFIKAFSKFLVVFLPKEENKR